MIMVMTMIMIMIMRMIRERHHGQKSWDEHGTKGAGQAADATSRKIQK